MAQFEALALENVDFEWKCHKNFAWGFKSCLLTYQSACDIILLSVWYKFHRVWYTFFHEVRYNFCQNDIKTQAH